MTNVSPGFNNQTDAIQLLQNEKRNLSQDINNLDISISSENSTVSWADSVLNDPYKLDSEKAEARAKKEEALKNINNLKTQKSAKETELNQKTSEEDYIRKGNYLDTPSDQVEQVEQVPTTNVEPAGTINESNTDTVVITEEEDLQITSTDKFGGKDTEGQDIKADNTFIGYDLSNTDASEKLNRMRGKTNQIDGKDMYTTPWDWRFGNAYTSTQSIGNYMPKGPEWVGSPSIMNPFALIRFNHVASNKHHIHLLDNKNNQLFRTAGLSRKQMSTDQPGQKIEVNSADNKVVMTPELKNKFGIVDDDPLYGKFQAAYKDSSGALWAEYEDANNQLWKPKYKEAKDLPEFPDVKKTETSPPEVTIEKKTGDDYNPNTEKYWMRINSLIKCPSASNTIYIPPAAYEPEKNSNQTPCDVLNKRMSEPQDKSQGKKELQEELLKYKKSVVGQYPREWTAEPIINKIPIMSNDMVPLTDAQLEPTIDNLCDVSNWNGQNQFKYDYSDFLYCKYWNKIPNNYLVTLRRFPNPTLDSGAIFGQSTSPQYVLPMAKAITWAGESTGNTIENLLGMSWKMNWREVKSAVNEVQGNEQGADQAGPFAGIGKFLGVMSSVTSGGGGYGAISGWDEQRAKFDPYKDGMYSNRVYGPVNAIDKTKARERGLELDQSITLKFHYTLKSLGGINPKAAMLDILANMLALTNNNAPFWGGANRYFPNKPAYPFPGGKKGFESWYKGDYEGFFNSLVGQLSDVGGNLMNTLQDLLTNPAAALKTLISGGTKTWMASKQAGKRPAILQFKSLLTGDPIGEWHLVIGNPFNPIAMMGNLIVTNTKLQFSEQFGVDDFPEDMTIEVTLEHGRPRDKGDIESIFNKGGGRLHYAPFGQKDNIWNTSSATKDSKIDTSWKKGTTNSYGASTGKNANVAVNGGGSYNSNLDFNSGSYNRDGVDGVIRTTKNVFSEGTKSAFKLAQKLGFASAPSNPGA